MAGENCILTAPGYGQKLVRCVDFSYGVEFQGTESATRRARTFYPMRETLSNFSIGLIYSRLNEYRSMVDWLTGFIRRISDPDQTPISMRVEVPARNFDQSGVPVRGVGYGEKTEDVTWKIDLSFIGVEDAITSFDSPLISQFLSAVVEDDVSKFFYPAGVQMDQEARGEQQAKDALAQLTIGGITINKPNRPASDLPDPRKTGPQ